ncbi:hypothetical protein NPIL_250021 [Nephila pilipes]|uniref:Uncharacterized protein n=1 Tax=Nephila pilipes TaxID=299642 RepID=A0A8X6ITJ3_NEPPI|nr:hypothetical protein NPIL_250021 [Nephila pilipes]
MPVSYLRDFVVCAFLLSSGLPLVSPRSVGSGHFSGVWCVSGLPTVLSLLPLPMHSKGFNPLDTSDLAPGLLEYLHTDVNKVNSWKNKIRIARTTKEDVAIFRALGIPGAQLSPFKLNVASIIMQNKTFHASQPDHTVHLASGPI